VADLERIAAGAAAAKPAESKSDKPAPAEPAPKSESAPAATAAAAAAPVADQPVAESEIEVKPERSEQHKKGLAKKKCWVEQVDRMLEGRHYVEKF
jgi:hypothetical protein